MGKSVENLAEGNILYKLTKLALPLMATSFVQMAYTLMAMSWVGRLGTKEEAAIGAIGMLLWLTSSVSLLALIGTEVCVGQSIGAKKMKRALKFASHGTTIATVVGLVWTMIFFVFASQILSFFKLDTDITKEAVTYLRIVTIYLPFQFLIYTFSGIYNGAGNSFKPFVINASGLVVNMILDPLLIFTFGMGLHGAAWGTVIAQLFVFGFFVYHLRAKAGELGSFSFLIKPNRFYLSRIFKIGFPVAVMNSFYAFINMNLARAASVYGGHLGLISQTTGGQIEGVTWTTSQGFSTALSAFVAQNYAAKKIERGKKAYIYTIRIMLSLGVAVSITFILFGAQIFGIIVPEENAMKAGAEYLAIMGFVQIFMMLELTTQGMFNGIGKTIPPALISITFNLLRIPLAYFLAERMGIIGVWWAIAISTICKGTILPIWFSFVYKREKKKQIL